MPKTIRVSQLSLSERLKLMEEIISSFSEQEQDFHSPAWHAEVLHEREAAVRDREQWRELEDVKKRLRS